jgi:hypothetical protein
LRLGCTNQTTLLKRLTYEGHPGHEVASPPTAVLSTAPPYRGSTVAWSNTAVGGPSAAQLYATNQSPPHHGESPVDSSGNCTHSLRGRCRKQGRHFSHRCCLDLSQHDCCLCCCCCCCLAGSAALAMCLSAHHPTVSLLHTLGTKSRLYNPQRMLFSQAHQLLSASCRKQTRGNRVTGVTATSPRQNNQSCPRALWARCGLRTATLSRTIAQKLSDPWRHAISKCT